jgi:ADP-ribosylglycohydrolase
MTLAVAKAIMEADRTPPPRGEDDYFQNLREQAVKYMQEIGRHYPDCGYGGSFRRWMFSDNPEPYNSYGNGAAMRVSPAGFFADDEAQAERLAEAVTDVTHDHEEGIKGAKATAVAIYMARRGALKNEIKECIERNYYPLDFRIDDIRPTYKFNETCQETVPQAIQCVLESTSFEDAIRTAISLGGDSDTIGAITGAIAEAYYGTPDEIKAKALGYLDDRLRAIYDEWEAFKPSDDERFKLITKYIGRMSDILSIDDERISYSDYFPIKDFEWEWLHSSFPCFTYGDVLQEMGVERDFNQICAKDIIDLDEDKVLALITSAFRNDYFDNGILIKYVRNGSMLKWLKRLKDIDWNRKPKRIESIDLELSSMSGWTTYQLLFSDDGAKVTIADCACGEIVAPAEQNIAEDIYKKLEAIHFKYWLPAYRQEYGISVCDGQQWELIVGYDDGSVLSFYGDNTYPENWSELLEVFGLDDDEEDDEDNNGD